MIFAPRQLLPVWRSCAAAQWTSMGSSGAISTTFMQGPALRVVAMTTTSAEAANAFVTRWRFWRPPPKAIQAHSDSSAVLATIRWQTLLLLAPRAFAFGGEMVMRTLFAMARHLVHA